MSNILDSGVHPDVTCRYENLKTTGDIELAKFADPSEVYTNGHKPSENLDAREYSVGAGYVSIYNSLFYGIKGSQLAAANMLLDRGANPNVEYPGFTSPLCHARGYEMTMLLRGYGADANYIGTAWKEERRSLLYNSILDEDYDKAIALLAVAERVGRKEVKVCNPNFSERAELDIPTVGRDEGEGNVSISQLINFEASPKIRLESRNILEILVDRLDEKYWSESFDQEGINACTVLLIQLEERARKNRSVDNSDIVNLALQRQKSGALMALTEVKNYRGTQYQISAQRIRFIQDILGCSQSGVRDLVNTRLANYKQLLDSEMTFADFFGDKVRKDGRIDENKTALSLGIFPAHVDAILSGEAMLQGEPLARFRKQYCADPLSDRMLRESARRTQLINTDSPLKERFQEILSSLSAKSTLADVFDIISSSRGKAEPDKISYDQLEELCSSKIKAGYMRTIKYRLSKARGSGKIVHLEADGKLDIMINAIVRIVYGEENSVVQNLIQAVAYRKFATKSLGDLLDEYVEKLPKNATGGRERIPKIP